MNTARATLLLFCALACVLVVDSTVNYRTVTFVNQCNQALRVGRTGAQCLPRNDVTYPQTQGCPAQMTLNPSTNQCHWDIPTFGNGTNLQPGENMSYTFSGQEFLCAAPATSSAWSGSFWAATGCNGGSCETGICYYGSNDPRNGFCTTYQEPTGPLTRAEFTFRETSDSYDVTSVDGVNIPLEIRPVNPSPPSISAIADYWCGNPGGINSTNGNLSGCSWMYDLRDLIKYGDQSVSLTLVAKGDSNQVCSRDSDCTTVGEVCGVLQQLDSSGGPGSELFHGRCGRLIGIWTSNAICAWTSGFTTLNTFPNNQPFRCMSSTGQGSGTFSELYRCAAPQYDTYGFINPYPNSCDPLTTCGCQDWSELGITAPALSPCLCNNTVWLNDALPWLVPIKKACPTSFSFPFDDTTSSFRCNSGPFPNIEDYTVTFCPGGQGIARAVQTAGGSMVAYQPGLLAAICALMIALLR